MSENIQTRNFECPGCKKQNSVKITFEEWEKDFTCECGWLCKVIYNPFKDPELNFDKIIRMRLYDFTEEHLDKIILYFERLIEEFKDFKKFKKKGFKLISLMRALKSEEG